MGNLFTIDIENIIKKYFKTQMEIYNLELKTKFYPILENDVCKLHFVKFDYKTLRFHFSEKGSDYEYKIDTISDILSNDNKGYHHRGSYRLDIKVGFEKYIENYIISLSRQVYKYLDRPLNGDFSWKNDYKIRQEELDELFDFIYYNSEGKTSRELLRKNNPMWEEEARKVMKK